jgi:hypothetical protein
MQKLVPQRPRPLILLLAVAGLAVAACNGPSVQSSSKGQAVVVAPQGSAEPASDAGSQHTADINFRPEKDGFSFPNYGTGPGLTDDDVHTLFGDAACISTDNGTCVLSDQAKAWESSMNDAMSGGHCYGFSVAALELFKGTIKPSDFQANDVASLTMDSPGLTDRISMDWAAQTLPTVQNAAITGTPNDILAKLIPYLQGGASGGETYTLRIFDRNGGGHAVTPFAAVDRGGGNIGVLVYDNNFPGVVREVSFDTNANTFEYNGAANPSEPQEVYDAHVDLFPTTPGEGQQPCPFCGSADSASSAAGSAGAAAKFYEVFLDGDPANHAHLVFTDDQGRRTGLIDGVLHTDVPGVTIDQTTYDEYGNAPEPVYVVQVGTNIDITVDGSGLHGTDEETIDVVGPGIDAEVQDIKIDPGQTDLMTLSSDGTVLGYKTTKSESPTLIIARETATTDWAAAMQVHGGDSGSTLIATLTDQLLGIGGADDTGATYDLAIARQDSSGKQVFSHGGITLNSGDVVTLDYTSFQRHGDSIRATYTSGGSTTEQTLEDQG